MKTILEQMQDFTNDLNDYLKQGKTEVGETGVNRLDIIKEKTLLIRIIGKRM